MSGTTDKITRAGLILVPRRANEIDYDAVSRFYTTFAAHNEHHGVYESFCRAWPVLLSQIGREP